MNYPSIKEYKEAILFAEDNFEQLKNLRPVLEDDGSPVMTSGNFAVVFKMKDEQTGKLHAVKCFLREQEGRAEAYRQIAEELEYVSSTFLTPIRYLDKELFVDTNASDDTEFPVLLMDWVEGETLDKYIRKHLDDQYELSLLAYQFSRLAMWLMPQPFAHGDLKPDNILVKDDGTLVLVDYDGMYVPAMKGQKARELGSPDFRHPGRTEEVFDDHIDDFSLASILLSLKAIALHSSLLEEYGASDRLLFSEKDYRNLSESSALGALQPLMQDAELASLYSLYILALSQNNLSQVSFRLFNLSRPDRSQYEEENLSTEVTEEDLANAWTDEYGVKYSADRKRLLKAPRELEYYTIRRGTKVICSEAFSEIYHYEVWGPTFCGYGSYQTRTECRGSELISINIPDSVTIIGNSAFRGSRLSSIYIPNSVKVIGCSAFEECYSLKIVVIPVNTIYIGDRAFMKCYSLSFVSLPNAIEKIGRNIFSCCDQLNSITIPIRTLAKFENLLPDYKDRFIEKDEEENLSTEVTEEDLANAWTDAYGVKYSVDKKRLLKAPNDICDYSILMGTIVICNDAFRDCKLLTSIIIADSVISIGKRAFLNCSSISSVKMSDGIRQIKSRAFFLCSSLTSVIIPQNVVEIGDEAYTGCINLISIVVNINNKIYDSRNNCNAIIETYWNSVVLGCSSTCIPDKVIRIGKQAFYGCENLHSIVIPDNVMDIDFAAFAGCINLENIIIPGMVDEIAQAAFLGCKKLQKINLPESVKILGNRVFFECTNLKEVSLPKSLDKIGQEIFSGCSSLNQIIVPIGCKKQYTELLPDYKDKIVERSNIVSIYFDNSSTSKVDRCRVFKKDNDWKLEIVYKNGMKVDYPHSLLQGNQSIEFDKQTISIPKQ